jgi:D-alanyl-D-alanine endopeptidase (penicillin-binding protein 7)
MIGIALRSKWTLLKLALGAAALAVAAAGGAATAPTSASTQAAKPTAARSAAKTHARTSKPATATRTAAAPQPQRKTARRTPVRYSPSVGHTSGLQSAEDALELRSSVALVIDQTTDEVLFSKNPNAVLPIASITKLMTALVVVESGLSMDELLVVTRDDVAATAGSNSRRRLPPDAELSRAEMLRLALMASENRAAYVLGRSYPGGVDAFVRAMNRKAVELGMSDTHYVEPTGLSSDNRSSAQDLARLVRVASQQPLIREYSTAPDAMVAAGHRQLQFRNTNGLVRNPEWEIGIQKTGYIAAAGRCLVMQAKLAGRALIMVLLDSAGRYSRIGDAERLRRWLDQLPPPQAMRPNVAIEQKSTAFTPAATPIASGTLAAPAASAADDAPESALPQAR